RGQGAVGVGLHGDLEDGPDGDEIRVVDQAWLPADVAAGAEVEVEVVGELDVAGLLQGAAVEGVPGAALGDAARDDRRDGDVLGRTDPLIAGEVPDAGPQAVGGHRPGRQGGGNLEGRGAAAQRAARVSDLGAGEHRVAVKVDVQLHAVGPLVKAVG